MRLQRLYPGARLFGQAKALSVPLPKDLEDAALVAWVGDLLDAIFPIPVPATEPVE
ncbi:hypothetical protein GCM10025881_29550 [Pseudolysinimonas kribbensis]|uniref:Uncharacterized protein n=1 Tax=Pseudolysinimonas kribbensis TaxID=433641 RepID=A0ABQ6K672_9MICO|nr:hypothetical protein GCM10025881_29550 [Pseudolysinimonas kribbensis]